MAGDEPKKYKRVRENGIQFLFKYDDDAPELLHIFARHLTTIDDALDTFFHDPGNWNADRRRMEAFSETHGLYWFWINQYDRIVMIISCFKL